MTEKVIELDERVDAVLVYGVNNSNLQLMKSLFPDVAIMARGRVVKVQGMAKDVNVFLKVMDGATEYAIKHNKLTEDKIVDLARGEDIEIGEKQKTNDGLILYGVNGKPITARTANQKRLVNEFGKNDLLFAVGPAGSGKTYTAIALAVNALKQKMVKKIILSRPAVEAGEKLGFLPGDMKEKIDPYLQPLYDALQDMIPSQKLGEYMNDGTIQIAPLAFMRGRTLSDAVVILDEAQNTTKEQIKMFLTRLGLGSKMIVTGDRTQIDLPRQQHSGLIVALGVLDGVKGISVVEFNNKDIVRHTLVKRIVEAFKAVGSVETE